MGHGITLREITNWAAYWVLFWTVVNFVLPPREVFKDTSPGFQKGYNTLLMLVAYYGSLNIRQVTVKLYQSVGQAPPPEPPEKTGP